MSKIQEIKTPTLGESVSEATIASWHKKVGDVVTKDELLIEIETDKVTLEVVAPTNGVLVEIIANEDDDVTEGDLIAKIEEKDISQMTKAVEEPKVQVELAVKTKSIAKIDAPLSPAPRKIIADNNLDKNSIAGTGKDARITKANVLNHLASSTKAPARKTGEKPVRKVKMSKLRQVIAARLKESQNTAAILSTFNEVDMTNLINLRAEYKDEFLEKYGVKLGFMSFFVKAVTKVLKEIPAINSEIEDKHIIYKEFYDIGVAVGSPQGLVVPIVRDADLLSLAEIETDIVGLAVKARDGKLAMEELTGGSFTISNGGVYGSMLSTPIINPPQSAILGMHNIQERAMVVNGEIKIRKMMYLALSYDHRLIDGKEAVTFLVRLKEEIENPKRLLLSL